MGDGSHNGQAHTGMNAPRVNISPFLQPHEAQALVAAGEDPAQFAVVEQVVDQMQIGLGQAQNGKLVTVVQMMLVIPAEILPLPTTQIVAADGQTAANTKLARAFHAQAPPRVRLPIRRESLGEAVLAALVEFEKNEREARLQSLLPPKPTE